MPDQFSCNEAGPAVEVVFVVTSPPALLHRASTGGQLNECRTRNRVDVAIQGRTTLIDLLIDVSELRLAVTGPRMLFEKLVVVTTLTALDGATAGQLRELADSLDGTIHCGLVGIQRAAITVAAVRSGAHVEIALGPPSMYQSELVLRTRTGETFRQLLLRLLTQDPTRPFLAGLHPVTATGHLEHHHGPDPHPQPGPEPDTGGHPGHGNHTGHGGTGGHGEPGGHSGQGA